MLINRRELTSHQQHKLINKPFRNVLLPSCSKLGLKLNIKGQRCAKKVCQKKFFCFFFLQFSLLSVWGYQPGCVKLDVYQYIQLVHLFLKWQQL